MSSDPDDLSARLKAIEASTGKRKAPARPSLFAALFGSAAILMIGGLGWMLLQPKPEPSLPTAAAEEFQSAGSGFGEFPATPLPEPAPAPAPVPEGPSAAELELRETLANLQAELAELRARPVETGDPAAQAAIADLTAQLAAMDASNAEARSALERQLIERDRELERIRMDLEIARLEAPGIGEDDARLAELERRRAAEAAAREARITSPMLAWSGVGGGANGESEVEAARLSADEAFVRGGAAVAPMTRAEIIVNPGHTVVQGTMIQAVLESAMDSTLPGVIRAVVSEDVHSFDGTRILIPRGAQLIGRYRSEVSLAQSRVMVGWDRIILPDNQTVQISAFGGDELGRSGVTGDVDSRFGTRFGSAALISLIGAVPAAAAASIDDDTTSDAASDVATDLRDASRSVMQDYLSIRPVIRVPQGTRITVMVDRDLEIL